jgi:nucleoside phosphorylase
MNVREPSDKRQCSLLLFVATSSEEKALRDAAVSRHFPFERIRHSKLGEYYWMGAVGNERVIAVRAEGMGPLGRRGSADLALRYQQETAASAIVQVGMAFGIAPQAQKYGDVLVSSSLIPYDNRDVRAAATSGQYIVDYARATRQGASPSSFRSFSENRSAAGSRLPFM